MFYRRKILLALLQMYGGKLPKIDFQKYLFLLNVNKTAPYFEFIPYKYGCFSFQANQDLSTMTKYNLVAETDKHWQLVDKTNYLYELKLNDRILISKLYQKFNSLKGDELIKYVYEHYPYYAVHSLKAKGLLDENDYRTVVSSKPYKNDFAVFTIGYEGKTIEHFTNELIKEDVRVLCDIRKNAFSMKYGFSKKQLKFVLENIGIKYIHIPELGIDSFKRQGLNTNKDYEELFRDYEKNTLPNRAKELQELQNIFISNKRIALMCFEAEHTSCHRSRTVQALAKLNKKQIKVQQL
jgi:uncharacterized protein (DUF488 family)